MEVRPRRQVGQRGCRRTVNRSSRTPWSSERNRAQAGLWCLSVNASVPSTSPSGLTWLTEVRPRTGFGFVRWLDDRPVLEAPGELRVCWFPTAHHPFVSHGEGVTQREGLSIAPRRAHERGSAQRLLPQCCPPGPVGQRGGTRNVSAALRSVALAVTTVPGWMTSVPPEGIVTSPVTVTVPDQVVVPGPRFSKAVI